MKTGFEELDKIIKLNKGELLILASRPAMGKTILGLNIAVNVAFNENIPTAIFNLEMSKEQIYNRLICNQAMISKAKFNTKNFDDNDYQIINKSQQELSKAEIYIDDTPAISIEEIEKECVKLKKEKNIELVIIDYLQLIKLNQKTKCWSRDIEVDYIINKLKEISNELNITIIVVSQLSREPEKRKLQGKDPRPVITDLPDGIVKMADVIMCLYRDEYYYEEMAEKNIAEISIIKNKYGDCGIVKLTFKGEYCKFESLDYKE